jgi:peptidoglycan/LPS O-acetylase OafA/YrhL
VTVSHLELFGGFGYSSAGWGHAVRQITYAGSFAVFFFFVLTGYLLFWPFVKATISGGRPVDLRRYFRNRALRILPLYYFVLVTLLLTRESGGSGDQWWHFLSFTSNFSHTTFNTVDGPMWSLGVEVQFYLLLPLMALFVGKIAQGSIRRASILLVTLGVASLAVRIVEVQLPQHPDPLWIPSLPTTMFFFVSGILLALLRLALETESVRLPHAIVASDRWFLLAGLLLCGIAADYGLVSYLLPVAGLLIVGGCVLPLEPGRVRRLLSWGPVALVGVISYSIYLWNFPVIEWVHNHVVRSFPGLPILGLAGTFGLSFLTYRLIEAPFLRLRRRWAPVTDSSG